MTSQAPIKVNAKTKQKIHYLAALRACTQAKIVEVAIDEYVVRHANELEAGLQHARQALRGGPVSEIAFVLDEDPDAVARVSSSPTGQ